MRYNRGILSLLAGISMTGLNFSFAQNMNVSTQNGSFSHNLSSLQSVVFKNGIFVIKDSDCGDNYYSDFFTNKIYFGEAVNGLDDLALTNLSVYPNPTADYIVVNASITESVSGIIYTIAGEKVKSFEVGSTSLKVDVSMLPAGVYLIQIGTRNIKFIKQ